MGSIIIFWQDNVHWFMALIATAVLSPLIIILIFRLALRNLSRIFTIHFLFNIRMFAGRNYLLLIKDKRNEQILLTLMKKMKKRTRKSGVAQLESISLSFFGEMRLFEVHYVYYAGLSILSLNDVTEIELLQNKFAKRIAAEYPIFEGLDIGIAIFDEIGKLNFCNQAQKKIWNDDIKTGNDLKFILNHLEENNNLPHNPKVNHFIKEEFHIFNTITEPREDILHYPNGRIVRRVTNPYPDGGILQSSEDITELSEIENKTTSLLDMHQMILQHNSEGIAIFDEGDKLQIWNQTFADIWQLRPNYLIINPHINCILEKTLPLLKQDHDNDKYKNWIKKFMSERKSLFIKSQLRNGDIVRIRAKPISEKRYLIFYRLVNNPKTNRNP